MRTWAMTSFLRIPAEMMANHSAKIFAFCKIIKFEDCAKVGSLFHLNFIVVYFLFIYFWVVWLNSLWNFSLILFRSLYFTSSVIGFLANDSPLFFKIPLLNIFVEVLQLALCLTISICKIYISDNLCPLFQTGFLSLFLEKFQIFIYSSI